MDLFYSNISTLIESKAFVFLIVLILFVSYLRYKLTFWKRQGIPNDVLHTYKSFNTVLHMNDCNCIKTNGKIVG